MAQVNKGRRPQRGSAEHTRDLVAWANPKPENGAMLYLEREKIRANLENPRDFFDGSELEGLAQTIRVHGILKPLTVRYEPGLLGTQYELIDGERRWRAAKLAGLDRVPVIVRDVDSKFEQLVMSLVANVQNAPLSTLEESEALGEIQQALGLTTTGLVELVGKGQDSGFPEEAGGKGWIENRLALYEAPEELKELLKTRPKAMSSVITVSRRIKQPDLIQRCAVRIRDGATLNEIQRLVNELAPLQKKSKAERPQATPAASTQGVGMESGGTSRPPASSDAPELFPVPPESPQPQVLEDEPVAVVSGLDYSNAQNEAARQSTTAEAERRQAEARDRYERLQGREPIVLQPKADTVAFLARARELLQGPDSDEMAHELGRLWREWAA